MANDTIKLFKDIAEKSVASFKNVGELNLRTFEALAAKQVEIVQNVFDLLEIESQNSRISLVFDKEYSSPVYVNADEERILQVLTNLLVNSLKYGLEGGRTEIAIQELENQKVLIRVMDTGEGIEKHHLPRLFERFYRVDPTRSRKKGGSGLGLSIVKHIIEAHNENIYVESEIGRGTTFSFTLDRL